MNFLNVVDWNMDFFVCNAALVTRKDWSHSAVNGAGFTPGILPSALRASLRLFKIAPGYFVPQLRRQAHGRKRSPAGGRSPTA